MHKELKETMGNKLRKIWKLLYEQNEINNEEIQIIFKRTQTKNTGATKYNHWNKQKNSLREFINKFENVEERISILEDKHTLKLLSLRSRKKR